MPADDVHIIKHFDADNATMKEIIIADSQGELDNRHGVDRYLYWRRGKELRITDEYHISNAAKSIFAFIIRSTRGSVEKYSSRSTTHKNENATRNAKMWQSLHQCSAFFPCDAA